LILFTIFILIVLSDVIEVLKENPIRRIQDKNQFKKLSIQFLVVVVTVIVVGQIFSLYLKYLIYILVMGIITYLLMINFSLRYLNEKQRFNDISQFMLRLCVYFRIYKKTQVTLEAASKDAPSWIKKELTGDLRTLHKLIPHYLMQSLIAIFDASEQVGYLHTDHQLKRLEQDIETWIMQTQSHQQQELTLQKRLMLLFGMGLLIAYLAQNMLDNALSVSHHMQYQQLVFLFLTLSLLGIIFSGKRLDNPWMLKDECL